MTPRGSARNTTRLTRTTGPETRRKGGTVQDNAEMPPAAREQLEEEEEEGEKLRQRLAGKYPAVQKPPDFFLVSQPDVEEEKHVPPTKEQRERGKERKEEEKLSGSEHDTPFSLGLRKIRVYPENSEKIAGGEEKARSEVAKAKRAFSLPLSFGEENF